MQGAAAGADHGRAHYGEEDRLFDKSKDLRPPRTYIGYAPVGVVERVHWRTPGVGWDDSFGAGSLGLYVFLCPKERRGREVVRGRREGTSGWILN